MNRSRSGSLLETPVRTAIFYVLVVLVLGAECSLFFLSAVPVAFFRFSNYQLKYITSLLAIVGFLAVTILSPREETKGHYIFGVPLALFIVMCICISFASAEYYRAALHSVLAYALPMIAVPLLYWALHGSTGDNRLYSFLINATIAFASCYALLCILQSLGISLMNSDYQSFGIRNDRLRLIYSGDFISFGAVLALGMTCRARHHRYLYIMLFGLMLFELYWVAQTRFFFIGLGVAAVVGFVIKGRSRTLKIIVIIITAIIVLLFYSDSLVSLLFPDDPILQLSSSARLEAYSFYPTHSMDMGIFGIGFIPYDSPHFSLINANIDIGHGGIDDIGVVEYISRYGICGLFVLLFSVAWFFKAFRKRNRGFSFSRNPEAWMVLAYFFALSPTMAITDPQRIFFLPFLALLIEHAIALNGLAEDIVSRNVGYAGEARMIRA
jgi:hypothetical protein